MGSRFAYQTVRHRKPASLPPRLMAVMLVFVLNGAGTVQDSCALLKATAEVLLNGCHDLPGLMLI